MLKFEAYKMSDLQTFMALLTQFEQKGVNTIKRARGYLQGHLDTILKESQRVAKVEAAKHIIQQTAVSPNRVKQYYAELPICPKCNKGRLEPVINKDKDEQLNIWGCKKCRYSTIMEVKDV